MTTISLEEMEVLKKIQELLKEMFTILDREEISNNGNLFNPTYITSCRTMDLDKLNKILRELKEISK